MTPIFADSGHYVALLLQTDQSHDRAVEITRQLHSPIVTTAWVLTEVGNTFSASRFRSAFVSLLDDLQADPNVRVSAPDVAIFAQGIELYRNRPDKNWSLTDCISFVVIEREGITELSPVIAISNKPVLKLCCDRPLVDTLEIHRRGMTGVGQDISATPTEILVELELHAGEVMGMET